MCGCHHCEVSVLQAAAIVTLPFDVVKTHRQVDLGMLDNKGDGQHFLFR